jgi:hypothetical protein
MATVTFELDDAIYRKAEEMLAEVGGIEAYLKALLEGCVAALATDTMGTVTLDAGSRQMIERARAHAIKSKKNGQ